MGCAEKVVSYGMIDDPHDEIPSLGAAEFKDRRRPNRRYVSKELLPLLRNPTGGHSQISEEVESSDITETIPSDDDLSGARGVIRNTFVGVLIWIGVAALAIFAWRK